MTEVQQIQEQIDKYAYVEPFTCMREIKFDFIYYNGGCMYAHTEATIDNLIIDGISEDELFEQAMDKYHEDMDVSEFILIAKRQYTGLKDKNGLTEIYEDDIIDENGLVIGNIYEMDKRETDTVIQGFGTKTWCETVSRAILLGCRYSE